MPCWMNLRDSFGVFEGRRARQIMSSVLIDYDEYTTILALYSTISEANDHSVLPEQEPLVGRIFRTRLRTMV
jgi:hypothetical protein